jgi:F420-dependent oxidoreductase-like protein
MAVRSIPAGKRQTVPMRLPATAVTVLVGPTGSGKSHWAAQHFRPEQVVSSDALRQMVGFDETDQRAGTDAFELLDLIVSRRLARKLLTVVDTTGLDPARRAVYIEAASRSNVPCHAVVFDTPADLCKSRNRLKARPVPAKVLASQLAARDAAVDQIAAEPFDGVHTASDVVDVVPGEFLAADQATARQGADPTRLSFGLQLSSFAGAGGPAVLADRIAEVAGIAEQIGFSSVWVMDHVVQIPQVGRAWEDIPESWSTVAWLAARTRTVRLGTLVTAVTMRNPAHLAKIVATVDVLSGGRAICGIGLAWWDWEHRLYGWDFPPTADRYALLEDTLQLLPLMWGPGAPAFDGRMLKVAEAVCYPRPVQEHIPILVGGSGEKKTLALAARFADACNLFGDPETVRRKVSVLTEHCERHGRNPAEVAITHLSTATVAPTRRELAADVERLASSAGTPELAAERLAAGTVEDQIGRYRLLAEAGVQTAIVSLPDVWTPGVLEAFGEVIAAFGAQAPGPKAQTWLAPSTR